MNLPYIHCAPRALLIVLLCEFVLDPHFSHGAQKEPDSEQSARLSALIVSSHERALRLENREARARVSLTALQQQNRDSETGARRIQLASAWQQVAMSIDSLHSEGVQLEERLRSMGCSPEHAKFERGRGVLEILLKHLDLKQFPKETQKQLSATREQALREILAARWDSSVGKAVGEVPSEALSLASFGFASEFFDGLRREVKIVDGLACWAELMKDAAWAVVSTSAKLNLATSSLMAPGAPQGGPNTAVESFIDSQPQRSRAIVAELRQKYDECLEKTEAGIRQLRELASKNTSEAAFSHGMDRAGDSRLRSLERSTGAGASERSKSGAGGSGSSGGKEHCTSWESGRGERLSVCSGPGKVSSP
jgi:hypothetical protein